MNRSPERFTRVALLLSLFGFFFRGYWIYSHDDHGPAGIQPMLDLVIGKGPAPFQWRIGPTRVAYFAYTHFHLPFRMGFSLEDLVCSTIAALLAYWLLCQRPLYRQADVLQRWLLSAVFFGGYIYMLAWQDWYKKSDTEPAACLTMLLLALWSATDGMPRRGARAWMTAVGILVVTAVEGVVRPEIGMWMACGIFAMALVRRRGPLALERVPALVTAALAAGLAAGIQLLMSRVIYPNARYEAGIIFMLKYDWHELQGWVLVFVYLAPAAWTAWKVWKYRALEDAAPVGFLLGAVPFVLTWILVGRIEEVRIFLPVGVTLIPLFTQMVARKAGLGEPTTT